jgi:hypothetical protein
VGEDGIGSTTQLALRRGRLALCCLPFRQAFYRQLESRALGSNDLGSSPAASQWCFNPVGAYEAEGHLIWLIQLGVLRREVDGQGLTERVRLTPLGRQVLEAWLGEIPRANPGQRLWGWLQRHRPRT